MEPVLKGILDKLPPWSFQVFAIVIAVGIVFYFVKTLYINKRFSDMIADVLSRDDRMNGYQEKIDALREKQEESEQTVQQTLSAIRNFESFLNTFNDLRLVKDPYLVLTESSFLLQRMLDMLAIDMKLKPGVHHRCGIWLYEDQMLTLRFSSAGFPKHYVGERALHVDRSVAGRCYRKQAIVQIVDVTKDEDWERNVESKSPYKALLCLPLGNFGVLTIDGLEPFHEAGRAIGEIYAGLVISVLTEHTRSFDRWAMRAVGTGNIVENGYTDGEDVEV